MSEPKTITSELSPLASIDLLDAAEKWDGDKAVIQDHLRVIEKLNKDIALFNFYIFQRLAERPDLQDWYYSRISPESV